MSCRMLSRVCERPAGGLLDDGVAHMLLLMVPSSLRKLRLDGGGSERYLRRKLWSMVMACTTLAVYRRGTSRGDLKMGHCFICTR